MGIIDGMQKGFQSWFNKDNNANFLFVTAALGWVLASFAQTFGLVNNKDLTKEDKKFLIPQEIADGVTNIGMYALVTTKLMEKSKKLLEPSKSGKPFVQLKDASGKILDYASNQAQYAKMGRNFETGAAIVGGIISTCILTPVLRNLVGAYMKKRADKNPDTKEIPVRTYDRTQPYFTQTYQNRANSQTFARFYQNNGLKI